MAHRLTPRLPHIPARDSGGRFSLDNPEDGTPIKEMFTLGDGLLLITEKCTYRIQVADQIDPERKNPTLPHNVRQKIFDHGTESKLLCNTLLLGKVMFRKEFLKVDVERAKHLAFDALGELIAMHQAAQEFKSAETAAIGKASQSGEHPRSLAIPSVGNVRAHCKTFMQKADHFAGALIKIVRLFYPEERAMNWDNFYELVKSTYGQHDNFTEVAALTVPLLKLVRNARDCLEHHNEGVISTDFQLQADGTIAPPTIAIDFRQSVHQRCPVSWFMDETAKAVLDAFEMIVVHLCSKHVQPFAGCPIVVAPLPDNYRAAWHVRFAYGMYYQDGQFAPVG
jgi:hypothetical protein